MGGGGGEDYVYLKSLLFSQNIRSPSNRVPDRCGEAPAVNHEPNVSFERHSDISLLLEKEKEKDGKL